MPLLSELKHFIKTSQNPLLVILGPTASGKTALSLKIAEEIENMPNGKVCEIISTDSRQIYKGLEIGSDILSKKDRKGIPHHMMAITTPDKELSLAEYKDEATKIINKIKAKKHIPMLVGGTGLYISAIIEGYDVPRVPPDLSLREKLHKEAEKKGNEAVHAKLKKLDPTAATQIHPNNLRYVIRAIEINMKTGHNKPNLKAKTPQYDVFMIGINWPREDLYKRIEQRVELQLKRGLIKEVEALLSKSYALDLPAMTSLGAKELIPYLKGTSTLEECIETLKKNTRNYSKRQMTWFRRYKNIHWITPEELSRMTA